MVSKISYFHPFLGKWSNLTSISIFFKWVGNHQLVILRLSTSTPSFLNKEIYSAHPQRCQKPPPRASWHRRNPLRLRIVNRCLSEPIWIAHEVRWEGLGSWGTVDGSEIRRPTTFCIFWNLVNNGDKLPFPQLVSRISEPSTGLLQTFFLNPECISARPICS